MPHGFWCQCPGSARVYTVDIYIQNNVLQDGPGSPCYLATLQGTGNKNTGGHGSPMYI
jgi:hypothetical protein